MRILREMYNSIAIVGHGPSMANSFFGTTIDSYNTVIRQKAVSSELVKYHSKDFGQKTDIVCGSYTIREALFWHPSAKVWVFIDSRHSDLVNLDKSNKFLLLPEFCNHWNNIYRSLRSSNFIKNSKMSNYSTSSSIGHNHMSCGLHTILYACEILKPKKLTLFGFDNIKNGEFTWSLTRGKEWNQYPDHRWDTENIMVNTISKEYSVEMEFK